MDAYRRRRLVLAALGPLAALGLLVTTGGLAGCGSRAASGGSPADPVTLRLGYFPNLTHATPIVGVEKGIFGEQLGDKVKLQASTFNAGPAAVEALFSGAVDAVYIGPNPTVNAQVKSKGTAIKVISGAASGGVFFVVKPGINGPEDLKGKKIATPQLGNTQDVALRYWLKQKGLTATKDGGGDVKILPQDNSAAVDGFTTGTIDGAWVPEPFASRLVAAGGKVLVDERDLWPGNRFIITNLVVRTDFLKRHREVVKRLVAGSVAANEFINARPEEAQRAVSDGIARITGKPLDAKLTAKAWPNIEFTDDPVASSLAGGARHAEEVGLLQKADLKGLYDLTLLNEIRKADGKPEVTGL